MVLLSLSTINYQLSTLHAALGCDSCHKGPPYGPDYANVGPLWNSHIKHTSAPFSYTCDICHIEVTTGPYTITFATNHANGGYNVNPKSGYSFTYSSDYSLGRSTCSNISCHGNKSAVWGSEVSCYDCHASTTDIDDYSFKNNITAMISTDSVVGWFGTGHGLVNTSNYPHSGRPGANLGGADGCKYCHDGTNYNHNDTTNFFRLANTTETVYNSFGDAKNGVCLVCHSTVTAGGYLGKNATVTKSTFTAHWTNTHSVEGSNTDGGLFCWDCHDPHGDYNVAYSTAIAYMLQALPVELTEGIDPNNYGKPAGTVTLTRFDFSTGTKITAWDAQDYVSSHTIGGYFRFACQTCHEAGVGVNYFTRSTWTKSAGHYDYETSTRCTTCHRHKDNFKGSGECIMCHSVAQGNRRAITTEFKGGATWSIGTWSHARISSGAVTSKDCAVCHREGEVSTDEINYTYHKESTTVYASKTYAGYINLRDPDSGGAIIYKSSFNETENAYLEQIISETGTGYKVENGSFSFVSFSRDTSTIVLEKWVTTVQNSLCLRCHDKDGASSTYAQVDSSPTSPFSGQGYAVDVDTGLQPTNPSYHPVKGKQNNPYCDIDTMLPPWNQYTKPLYKMYTFSTYGAGDKVATVFYNLTKFTVPSATAPPREGTGGYSTWDFNATTYTYIASSDTQRAIFDSSASSNAVAIRHIYNIKESTALIRGLTFTAVGYGAYGVTGSSHSFRFYYWDFSKNNWVNISTNTKSTEVTISSTVAVSTSTVNKYIQSVSTGNYLYLLTFVTSTGPVKSRIYENYIEVGLRPPALTRGDLLSCWDCHLDTSPAVARPWTHGGGKTSLRVAYNRPNKKATTLCTVCHSTGVYWGASTATIVGKTAFDGTVSPVAGVFAAHPYYGTTTDTHNIAEAAWYGCTGCHGNAGYAAAEPRSRRERGQDVHGFIQFSTFTATTWASGSKPYAFLRNTRSTQVNWHPFSPMVSPWWSAGIIDRGMCVGTGGTLTAGSGSICGQKQTGHGGAPTEGYKPGGSY